MTSVSHYLQISQFNYCTFQGKAKMAGLVTTQFFAAGALLAAGLSACSTPKVNIPMQVPGTLGVPVTEVTLRRFAAERNAVTHAATLVNLVTAGLGKNGAVAVRTNASHILEGQLEVSRWELAHAMEDDYKLTRDLKYVKDGKKCVYTKTASLTGTYTLNGSDGTGYGGGSFSIPMTDKGSDKSCSKAKIELASDGELVQTAMEKAAQKIVAALSPHQVEVNVKLLEGDSEDNKAGIEHFQDGRRESAMNIWVQVSKSQQDTEARAAAFHNIGVLLEIRGELKSAFDNYAYASTLMPSDKDYRRALTRLEERQKNLNLLGNQSS